MGSEKRKCLFLIFMLVLLFITANKVERPQAAILTLLLHILTPLQHPQYVFMRTNVAVSTSQ